MISESTTDPVQRFKFTLLWNVTVLNEQSWSNWMMEKDQKQGKTLAWNGLLKTVQEINIQLIFKRSKPTVETREKSVKYVQS